MKKSKFFGLLMALSILQTTPVFAGKKEILQEAGRKFYEHNSTRFAVNNHHNPTLNWFHQYLLVNHQFSADEVLRYFQTSEGRKVVEAVRQDIRSAKRMAETHFREKPEGNWIQTIFEKPARPIAPPAVPEIQLVRESKNPAAASLTPAPNEIKWDLHRQKSAAAASAPMESKEERKEAVGEKRGCPQKNENEDEDAVAALLNLAKAAKQDPKN